MGKKEVHIDQQTVQGNFNIHFLGDEPPTKTAISGEMSVLRNARVDDLDQTLLAQFHRTVTKKTDASLSQIKRELAEYDLLKPLEGDYLVTLACALFCYPNLGKKGDGLMIDFTVLPAPGSANTIDSERVTEPIPLALTTLQHLIARHLRKGYQFNSFSRSEIFEIPMVAIREALVNALAHRDYYSNQKVFVTVYQNHSIQIVSPGTLYGKLTLKQLKGNRYLASHRNPKIITYLYPYVAAEGKGLGMIRMREAMRNCGLPEPVITQEQGCFKVVLQGPGAKFAPSKYPRSNSSNDYQAQNATLDKLSERQKQILQHVIKDIDKKGFTAKWVEETFKVGKSVVNEDLKLLRKLQLIEKRGAGRNTNYILNSSSSADLSNSSKP